MPSAVRSVSPRTFRTMMRMGIPLAKGGTVAVLALAVLRAVVDDRGVKSVFGVCMLLGLLVWLAGFVLLIVRVRPAREPRTVGSPVTGRWMMLNSPGSTVPSHGVHSLGQTFAVDMVVVPEDAAPGRRGEPAGRGFLAPERFPSFGLPIHAPAMGKVVAVYGSARDHRTRTGPFGLAFLLLEGMIRELAGARFLLGNHVVLDLGDGTYAVCAHLRKSTLRVGVGDVVEAGEQLAECGNSGNSSEPHLHFQLMDHPRASRAAGVPFQFTDIDLEDGKAPGVPANKRVMTTR